MWIDILNEFSKNPRDVHTVPTQKREPVWFHVFCRNTNLYIESAHEKIPASEIAGVRMINKDEYGDMLKLYHRRCNGEKVSQEAQDRTMNQVYWYGIFAEMNM